MRDDSNGEVRFVIQDLEKFRVLTEITSLPFFQKIGIFSGLTLSHDGGRRYGIMTTNMSKVFNSVLKGARNLPITALVQLTFFRLNSYFVARREQGANRLASDEQYTPYVDAQIKARVVKTGSMEIFLYDHI